MSQVANTAESLEIRESMSIGEAADLLGISVFTLRMYERAGLILPRKKASGHRVYSPADVERIRCIRSAINDQKISIAGIQRIHSLIPCWQIVTCAEDDRKNCEAFSSHLRGCWAFRHTGNMCAGRDCTQCPAYLDFTDCGTIKQKIRLLTNTHESPLA